VSSDEPVNYARCVNDECRWKGFSFKPPPDAEAERKCPSCKQPLVKWKPEEIKDERRDYFRRDSERN
jgi:hypothetical protein